MKIILTIIIACALSVSSIAQNLDRQFEEKIGQCASINSGDYTCNSYLELANYIQTFDQTEAIEILKNFAKTGKYEDQIIILTKMLFQAKEDSVLRRPMIGAAGFAGNTDYEDWPLEPIEIINDIPFLITSGYSLGGRPESSIMYLEYCIKNGEWTKNNYSVKNIKELKYGLKLLFTSKKWNTELTSYNIAFFEKQISIMPNPSESSLLYCNSELCSIQVGSTLYEGPNPDYFYIKVEIKNTSDNIIGIDLSDKWKIIYPNQWGNLETPQRQIIDESRVAPDELDKNKMDNLFSDYKNNKLEFIDPQETFTYYTEFNANGKDAIDKESEIGNFMYLSLDGQLFLTDGSKCERICFEEDTPWIGNSIIAKPLIWDKIVNEDLIIDRD